MFHRSSNKKQVPQSQASTTTNGNAGYANGTPQIYPANPQGYNAQGGFPQGAPVGYFQQAGVVFNPSDGQYYPAPGYGMNPYMVPPGAYGYMPGQVPLQPPSNFPQQMPNFGQPGAQFVPNPATPVGRTSPFPGQQTTVGSLSHRSSRASSSASRRSSVSSRLSDHTSVRALSVRSYNLPTNIDQKMKEALARKYGFKDKITYRGVLQNLCVCVSYTLNKKIYPYERLKMRAAEVLGDLQGPQKVQQLYDDMTDKEAMEMGKLGLWDICILCDDSSSMNAKRVKQVKQFFKIILPIATTFDDDGLWLEFLWAAGKKGLTKVEEIERLVDSQTDAGGSFTGGGTPTGYALNERFLKPILRILKNAKPLEIKPFLVIIFTDGKIEWDGPRHDRFGTAYFKSVLVNFYREVAKLGYSQGIVRIMFAQVGDNEAAAKQIGELDVDREVGPYIDACFNYEKEDKNVKEAQRKRGEPEVGISIEGYILKLLLGAISKRDKADEAAKLASVLGQKLRLARTPTPAAASQPQIVKSQKRRFHFGRGP